MLGLLNIHAWSRASRNLIVKRNSKDRMPRLNQDNNNGKANKAKQSEANRACCELKHFACNLCHPSLQHPTCHAGTEEGQDNSGSTPHGMTSKKAKKAATPASAVDKPAASATQQPNNPTTKQPNATACLSISKKNSLIGVAPG